MRQKLACCLLISVFLAGTVGCASVPFNKNDFTYFSAEPEFIVMLQMVRSEKAIGMATGFVINSGQGFIVTAKHFIRSSRRMNAGLEAVIGGKKYPLSIVWVHQNKDMAILKIDRSDDLKLAQVSVSEEGARIGDVAVFTGLTIHNKKKLYRYVPIIIGKANKKEIRGRVLRGEWAELRLAPIRWYGGLSGAPLLSRTGQCIGIFFWEIGPICWFVSARQIPQKYLPR